MVVERAAQRPVSVAVVADVEIVVAGVAAVLAPYVDRVMVVPWEPDRGRASSRGPVEVDIVLFDMFDRTQQHGLVDLADLSVGETAKVVVFSWSSSAERVAMALGRGASGYIAKSLEPAELVGALERVHRGERVVALPAEAGAVAGAWSAVGLTPREAQVVALVACGLTNPEIGERVHLGVNSVKTYTRTAYRKIGVSRRSQVVLWALEHGLTLSPEVHP